jgi:hypothetical protein
MPALESDEMRDAIRRIVEVQSVGAVLLEPELGKAWLYDTEGKIAQFGSIFEVERDLDGKYCHCILPKDSEEGIWKCTVYDGDALVREFTEQL